MAPPLFLFTLPSLVQIEGHQKMLTSAGHRLVLERQLQLRQPGAMGLRAVLGLSSSRGSKFVNV